MEKTYDPQEWEEKIYQFWEKSGSFTPKVDEKKKPFSILLPLPNANDPMHMGHALFVVEDILTRYHRMLGVPTLWLPGADHAGIETQYVFEKNLAKEGKSRLDFDRKTLYHLIEDYVEKNRLLNKKQLGRLGFSLDWTRYHYSLEPKIVDFILNTFHKLHRDNLIYRAERIVNYCPKCGTAYSELEIDYREREDFLYFLNYGPVNIATTRPETIFADVAIAINPKDKRYQKLVGQKAIIPLINKKITIIESELVDPDFGTGALKITPAHDPVDFEIGQKNGLEKISVIDRGGKMINLPSKYEGLKVAAARQEVIKDLETSQKLIKTEPLLHSVGTCYKCGTTIEPMLLPQWFIKIKPLAEPALKAVKEGKTKIVPKKRFYKMYIDWMENIHDWNISRQIVWGPQIPAWYCLDCNPDIHFSFIDNKGEKVHGTFRELKEKYPFSIIKSGLQALSAPVTATYSLEDKSCAKCGGINVLQETDTFDTWFLSGQWPLTTLGFPDSHDFKYFYPTSVLDTLWDILFFWVARMMMFGLYLAKDVPFKVIHLHCRVVDEKGQKMSKSKGNVINPMEMVEKYGADALRMALIYGAAPGSDIHVSDDKIRSMRNFANKIWNASRFVLSQISDMGEVICDMENKLNISQITNTDDKWILKETKRTVKAVTQHLENYRFDLAAEEIYQFFWHEFCDQYIEKIKPRLENSQSIAINNAIRQPAESKSRDSALRRSKLPSQEKDAQAAKITLLYVLATSLKLLHPFMPFVTEAVWGLMPKKTKDPLITSPWPV